MTQKPHVLLLYHQYYQKSHYQVRETQNGIMELFRFHKIPNSINHRF